MRRGIYIGWVGNRNLGDESMFHVCRLLFPRLAWSPLPLQDARRRQTVRERGRAAVRKAAGRLRGDAGLLGGGTLINASRLWLVRYQSVAERTGKPVPVFSTGVFDPLFWSGVAGWTDIRSA